jgi:hypothetical protein
MVTTVKGDFIRMKIEGQWANAFPRIIEHKSTACLLQISSEDEESTSVFLPTRI